MAPSPGSFEMFRKSTWRRSASFAAISTLPVILGCTLLGATAARADYVAEIEQVGSNVEVMGSGAFDTTGLMAGAINGQMTTFALPGIQPNLARLPWANEAPAALLRRLVPCRLPTVLLWELISALR